MARFGSEWTKKNNQNKIVGVTGALKMWLTLHHKQLNGMIKSFLTKLLVVRLPCSNMQAVNIVLPWFLNTQSVLLSARRRLKVTARMTRLNERWRPFPHACWRRFQRFTDQMHFINTRLLCSVHRFNSSNNLDSLRTFWTFLHWGCYVYDQTNIETTQQPRCFEASLRLYHFRVQQSHNNLGVLKVSRDRKQQNHHKEY